MGEDADGRRLGLGGRLSLLLPGALVVVGFGSLVPVLPQLGRHFAGTPYADAIVRALVTGLGGAMAVGGPLGGRLAERFGERRTLLAALAVFAVAGTAGLVIENLWLLLADRLLVGLALAAVGVTSIAILANRLADAERNRWLGFLAALSNGSTVLLMPLVVVLAAMGWRLIFPMHLLALPIFALILWFVPARAPAPAGALQPTAQAARARVRGLARPTGGFPFGLVLLGLACGGIGTTLPAFLAYRFREIGHPDPSLSAAALVTMTIGATIFSFTYGWARRFASVTALFVLAFALIGVALLWMALSSEVAAALAAMALVGAGLGFLSPNLSAIAADAAPERRARRIGLARAAYFGAALVTQTPLEPISARCGAGGVFLVMCVFAFAMSGALAVAPGQRARSAHGANQTRRGVRMTD